MEKAKALTNINQLFIGSETVAYLAGSKQGEPKILDNAAVVFDSNVRWVGNSSELKAYLNTEQLEAEIIDCSGKSVLPGLIDSHTHYPFAGNRSGEFAMRLRGATYEEIAEAGGGIQNTVKSTRESSIEQIYTSTLKHVRRAAEHGVTSIEMKSGYTLTREGEIKQLEVIKLLDVNTPLDLYPTFMGAHDFPKELKPSPEGQQEYIDFLCSELIPEVAEKKLAVFNDVFIDKGYYSTEQGLQVLEAGIKYGLSPRAHCEELVNLGSAGPVSDIGALSIDHLICINEVDAVTMAKNTTVATMLPGVSYFLRKPYMPARMMIEKGVPIAVATDFNPGSSHTNNLQMAIQLACIQGGLTVLEALTAATVNAAYSLRDESKGSISVGKRADFAVMDCKSLDEIIYLHGVNHCVQTWKDGELIFEKQPEAVGNGWVS
ncbi:MAG: imidazolonepropionase [Candidatus Kapaibacteriales bacterium]